MPDAPASTTLPLCTTSTLDEQAAAVKATGNDAYVRGDYEAAIGLFSRALQAGAGGILGGIGGFRANRAAEGGEERASGGGARTCAADGARSTPPDTRPPTPSSPRTTRFCTPTVPWPS